MEDIPQGAEDYRLTSAEIFYHTPDYPDLLQSYLWQGLDQAPEFPKLNSFIESWEKNNEVTWSSIRIGYVGIITPTEWKYAECNLTPH